MLLYAVCTTLMSKRAQAESSGKLRWCACSKILMIEVPKLPNKTLLIVCPSPEQDQELLAHLCMVPTFTSRQDNFN